MAIANPLTREEAQEEISKLVSAEYVSGEEIRVAMRQATKILSRVENNEERQILSHPLESLAMLQMALEQQ